MWAVNACRELSPGTPVMPPNEFALSAERIARMSRESLIGSEHLKGGGLLDRAVAYLKHAKAVGRDASWEKMQTMFSAEMLKEVLMSRGKYRWDQFDYDRQGALK